jgi:SAM-dependent methyltransferase
MKKDCKPTKPQNKRRHRHITHDGADETKSKKKTKKDRSEAKDDLVQKENISLALQKKRIPRGSNQKESGKKTEQRDSRKGKGTPDRKKGQQQRKNDKESQKADREVWSKSKKKRMRKLKAKMNKMARETPSTVDAETEADKQNTPEKSASQKLDTPQAETSSKKGSALQKSYAARLSGSRFRILNEELYTSASSTAFERFTANPELYNQYHEGFRHQVEQWPSNPVDVIFRWLTKKYASSAKDAVVVADFGCGDAELAKRLLKVSVSDKAKKSCPFKVHSFDLVASSDFVTACDMANVPLGDKSVDVGVFCLALMGTNVADFLREAHRVLKDNGRVKVAEVRSRFESTKKKDDLEDFTNSLKKLGFDCVNLDRSNKMFVLMELKKNGKKPDSSVDVAVKPCIYKRR